MPFNPLSFSILPSNRFPLVQRVSYSGKRRSSGILGNSNFQNLTSFLRISPAAWFQQSLQIPMLSSVSRPRFPVPSTRICTLRTPFFSSEPLPAKITNPSTKHVSDLILQQKSAAAALRTFRWASKLSSFCHDASTYRSLVRSLVYFRRFDLAKKILLEIPTATGFPPDDDTIIAIVRGLGRSGMIRDAVGMADLVKIPSVKVYNSILNVLVKENIDLARDFYRSNMTGSPIRGDDYTFGILMKGLCRTNRIAEGFKLLKIFRSSRLPPNPVIYNTLVHCLCRNGKVGRARSLVGEMVCPNDVTFNIMISAYCLEGNFLQALVMLDKCLDLGFLPSVIAVTKIVDLLCKEARFKEAMEILRIVEEKGGVVDVVAYNTLIEGFCKAGKPRIGRRIVKFMESKGCFPNLSTYNSLISGFCSSGDMNTALDLFEELKEDQISPDFSTFETIIRGFCSVGRVEDGFKLLKIMEVQTEELGRRIQPYNSIIYGLYRENRLPEAQLFLEKMREYFPRCVEWHSKIFTLCRQEFFEEAMKAFEQFIEEGGTPSALAFVCLIEGLSCEKSSLEAFNLIKEMIQNGYLPSVSTFNCLVSGFCREGKTRSALKLKKEMVSRGCLPDSGTYNPIIERLCREGDFFVALQLFVEMGKQGLTPDIRVWESMIDSLIQSSPRMENQDAVCKMVDELLSI